MDGRRRMTLTATDPNLPMIPSSIPVPSSALKKRPESALPVPNLRTSQKNRMSMAGPPQRLGGNVLSQSQLQPIQPQGSSQGSQSNMRRTSMWDSQPRTAIPMSASRGDGGYYGKTPQLNRNGPPGSIRRSSQYSGRASTLALMQLNQPKIETRPIRDKVWQANAHRVIYEHLVASNYPLAVSPKTLQSPTTKDFQTIFKFLVSDVLDQGYTFGKGGKKFEDEVIGVLKDLRYPHAEQLSRTALTAVGSMHTWPAVLAMLYWMVELSQAKLQWLDPDACDDPYLTPIEKLSPEHNNMAERYFMDYLSRAYSHFLEGNDDFSELDQRLRQDLEQGSAGIIQETDDKEKLLHKTKGEVEKLKAPSEMDQLEKEHELQLADSIKFQKMIEHNNSKKAKLEDALQVLNAATVDSEERLVKLRDDHGHLIKAVEAQNLSPEEATRMTTERDTLARTLEDLRSKLADANKTRYELEMASSRRLAVLSDSIDDYMKLAYRVNLYPTSPIGFEKVDFGLDIVTGATDPAGILVGMDIRSVIRPELIRYNEEKRRQRTAIDDERIVVDDELDRLTQIVDNQREELENRELRLSALLEQADEVKEAAAADTSASTAESAKLEREVANIRAAAHQTALAVDSRLQALEIEYADLQHKTMRLREEVLKEIVNHTEAIVTFRTQVSASLDSLALYADNN